MEWRDNPIEAESGGLRYTIGDNVVSTVFVRDYYIETPFRAELTGIQHPLTI